MKEMKEMKEIKKMEKVKEKGGDILSQEKVERVLSCSHASK